MASRGAFATYRVARIEPANPRRATTSNDAHDDEKQSVVSSFVFASSWILEPKGGPSERGEADTLHPNPQQANAFIQAPLCRRTRSL